MPKHSPFLNNIFYAVTSSKDFENSEKKTHQETILKLLANSHWQILLHILVIL